MITIAMTMKNRASYLEKSFQNILYQQFDPKNIEISITDGGSTDCIHAIINKYKDKFRRVVYAISDRSVLPFPVNSNCPACDINAQICNCTTGDIIIRKDPEIMFTDRVTIHHIIGRLQKYPEMLIHHNTLMQADPSGLRYYPMNYAGFCLAFKREEFIRNGGMEEKFARGFACEDTALIRYWETNRKAEQSPHYVIHLWHEPPQKKNPEYMRLHERYSRKLFKLMIDWNIKPNRNNPAWRRKEMIKDMKVIK